MHLARARSSPSLYRERALWGQQPDGEGLLKEIAFMVEVNLMNEKGLVVQLKERESEVLSAGWLTPGVVVLRMV